MACFLDEDDLVAEATESPAQNLSQAVPALSKEDKYHVFISCSSKDSIWVNGLIHQLEKTLPGLKICYHERDFTPGKTIIDNMVESIQKSQKTLMVLSPDFVCSRWCLFEANLSLFRDCMGHKAIVPIMLKPCPVPFYLSHLTYLEAEDDKFFEKLVHIILNIKTPEAPEIMYHFQTSVIYSGKSLCTVAAVNEHEDHCDKSIFSESCVPDSLRAVIEDSEAYIEAIRVINATPAFNHLCNSNFNIIAFLIFFSFMFGLTPAAFIISHYSVWLLCLPLSIIPWFIILIRILVWKKNKKRAVTEALAKSISRANLILMKSSVLAGCTSKAQLFFVYVTLQKCKQRFQVTFGQGSALPTAMWEKAIVKYSCDYASCLFRKHFPFKDAAPAGHLDGGTCFCHYVISQIQSGDWP